MITAMFRKAKVTPQTQFEVMDLRTIFTMVQEGMGVTIVPEMALPSNLAGLYISHIAPSLMRDLAFAVPSLETASPEVTIFWQQAKEWASPEFLSLKL